MKKAKSTRVLHPFLQEGDKLRDEDLYKFLADLKRPSNQLKKKCLPGLLKLDISPVRDQPKYCLTSELVKLHPYPGDSPFFTLHTPYLCDSLSLPYTLSTQGQYA